MASFKSVDKKCHPLFDRYSRMYDKMPISEIMKETGFERQQIDKSRRRWADVKLMDGMVEHGKPLGDFMGAAPDTGPVISTVPAYQENLFKSHGECGCSKPPPIEPAQFIEEPIPHIKQHHPEPTQKNGIYTLVVMGCCHFQAGSKFHPSSGAVFKFCGNNHVDEILFNGDTGTYDSLSWFNKNKPLLREGMRLEHDYNAVNYATDVAQSVANKVTMNKGNHEARVDKYIENNSELQGLMDIPVQLKLEQRGIQLNEWNDPYVVGKAMFVHGHKYNMHHPKSMLEIYGTSVYYNHTHDVQCFVRSRVATGTIEAHSMGCLTNLNPDYVKNIPRRHDNAFGIFHFMEDGTFTRYIPIIMNGKFVGPDGKLYCG